MTFLMEITLPSGNPGNWKNYPTIRLPKKIAITRVTRAPFPNSYYYCLLTHRPAFKYYNSTKSFAPALLPAQFKNIVGNSLF